MNRDEFWQLAYLAVLNQTGCCERARTAANMAVIDLDEFLGCQQKQDK